MSTLVDHSARSLSRSTRCDGSAQRPAKTTMLSSLRSESSPRLCFKQPQWLLPSGSGGSQFFRFVEAKPDEKILEHRGSRCYKVELVTSSSPRSSLSEPGGRIWLSLIGQSGEAALQCVESGSRFQSGDADVIQFLGPDLGKLEALWIGPEKGAWRLEKASVEVSPEKNDETCRYIFKGTGELIGDGGDVLALELKPETKVVESSSSSRDESLEEYESLKRSLLVAQASLVLLGGGVLALSGWRDETVAFFLGGAAGFAYLFLLEGKVDRIGKGDGSDVVRKVLVLSIVFAGIVVMQGFVRFHNETSPRSLLGGAAGFLMYRIAVLLAAATRKR